MKASTVNKLNNLLNIGIPASKQEDRSHHGIVEYIDPTHVIGVVAFIEDGDTASFLGDREENVNIKNVLKITKEFPSTHIDREYLIKILQHLDCETVTLRTAKDSPLYIQGTLEKTIVEAVIAPRIEEEAHDRI